AEERRFGRGGGPAGGRRQLAVMRPDMAAAERRFGRGGGPAGGRRQLAFMGPDMAVEERRFGRGGGPTGGGRLRADSRGMERIAYDEFAYFRENAAEFGLPYEGPPVVRRESVGVGPGGRLSALVWGDAPPEIVLLHGGAQNAHTWDTVALAVGRRPRRGGHRRRRGPGDPRPGPGRRRRRRHVARRAHHAGSGPPGAGAGPPGRPRRRAPHARPPGGGGHRRLRPGPGELRQL